jgi:Tfp pilus assembly protein PilE
MAEWVGQNPKTGTGHRERSRARGVTFIEVMLAAAILALMVLALFEGIAVSARIARENAEYLQADAYAFDLAWKRYNEGYSALRGFISATSPVRTFDENITSNAAPMLYRTGAPAKSYTTIRRIGDSNDESVELGILISVNVEWGESDARRQLSSTHTATMFKGGSEDG